MLNAFKREVPHLLPKLSRDGGKIGVPEEVDEELKLPRLENDMLKLKVHQAKETKKLYQEESFVL